MALIENIQREDLNAIDEATAYRRLVDEFSLTQEAVATAVGKDRATVANTLRLLKLPAEVQGDVAAGAITMGHARALLALPGDTSQLQLAARDEDARPVGPRDRGAGQARARRRSADAPTRPPRRLSRRRRPHARRRRQTEARCLARACASSARPKAAGSRSTSATRMS